ncbi:hypothetical protein WMY93_010728 [Mugilogobius chulae]|uniref:Growth factor receptor bound protein 7 n=1 Tax=Mugilogobius chulae TaxID=88201 RepID=A0AAW0PH72_9GOBI
MEVAGPWSEVFEGSGRTGSPEEESFLGGSTMTLAPLVSEPASVRRSQPILIATNSGHESIELELLLTVDSMNRGIEAFSSSVPSIPNPFPELCSPSKSPVISSLPPTTGDKHLIKVYGEDTHSRSVWVSPETTAREVCHMLVQTAHCSDQENWALLEVHPALGLERVLEDHEIVWEVQTTWSLKSDTRLVFRKNYAKYEFFRKPTLFFPESMISDSADVGKGLTSAELIQNLLKSGTCPEIQGYLQSKEPSRKSWKKVYYFLRRSGLYCSTKNSSKEPRHLQYVADLEDLNVYTVVNSKKLYGAPTDFTFCIKPSKNPVRAQDLKFLCADSEQTRTCWTSSFRLFKHGKQLQCNYQLSKLAPQRREAANHFTDTKSKSEASLVAMDFSGKAGGGSSRTHQKPAAQRGRRVSLEEERSPEVQFAEPELWPQTFLNP